MRKDGRADMTKLIIAFCSSANLPKNRCECNKFPGLNMYVTYIGHSNYKDYSINNACVVLFCWRAVRLAKLDVRVLQYLLSFPTRGSSFAKIFRFIFFIFFLEVRI
jgi:hypothetical protein